MLKVSNACNNAKISKQKKNQHEFKSIIGKLNAVSQYTDTKTKNEKYQKLNLHRHICTPIQAIYNKSNYTTNFTTNEVTGCDWSHLKMILH